MVRPFSLCAAAVCGDDGGPRAAQGAGDVFRDCWPGGRGASALRARCLGVPSFILMVAISGTRNSWSRGKAHGPMSFALLHLAPTSTTRKPSLKTALRGDPLQKPSPTKSIFSQAASFSWTYKWQLFWVPFLRQSARVLRARRGNVSLRSSKARCQSVVAAATRTPGPAFFIIALRRRTSRLRPSHGRSA